MQPAPSSTDSTSPLPPEQLSRSRLYVTHAVLSLDCGGLERVVVDLVREGTRRGQHVSILCLERPGILAGQVERMGARVVCLHKPPGLRWEIMGAAHAGLEILQPEVVHTHQLGALVYITAAAAKSNIQIVHTEHSNHLARASTWARRWRYRLMLGWCGRTVGRFCCVASDIAREVVRLGIVPSRKVHVVPNGIGINPSTTDTDPLQTRNEMGIPADAPVIGTVGRLHPVKNQELLIRAFAALLPRCPDTHLVIVGSGPSHRELAGLADRLGLADRIHLTGYRTQPKPLLEIMDVFALTSRWEGMPLVILEAWASGLPVVSSAVGGVPELVQSRKNGLLFRSGDEAGLTAALEEMLKDRDLARELGAAGRAEVMNRYSLDRMTAQYERYYRELLADGANRSS